MRYCILITAAYIALALDATLVDLLAVGRVAPDVLAIVALACALSWPASARTVWVVGLIGLVSDLAASGRLGAGMASFALVAYTTMQLRGRIDTHHPLVQAALTWPAATVIAVCAAAAQRIGGELDTPVWGTLGCCLLVGGYTAALSLPVWMVFGWIAEPLLRRQRLADAW